MLSFAIPTHLFYSVQYTFLIFSPFTGHLQRHCLDDASTLLFLNIRLSNRYVQYFYARSACLPLKDRVTGCEFPLCVVCVYLRFITPYLSVGFGKFHN